MQTHPSHPRYTAPQQALIGAIRIVKIAIQIIFTNYLMLEYKYELKTLRNNSNNAPDISQYQIMYVPSVYMYVFT